MLNNTNIAFIGSGTMAEAMIKGLLRQDLVPPSNITASGPRKERADDLRLKYGVVATGDNVTAADSSQIVVLSVKPQVLRSVLLEMQGKIEPGALLLSIVAGATTRLIADTIGHESVVRAMPNTPAQIGEGITVWTATESVTNMQEAETESLLSSLGETVRVDDDKYLDMATALSGTGPAYVLLFMEAMIDAGVHLGFSRRVAERLVI